MPQRQKIIRIKVTGKIVQVPYDCQYLSQTKIGEFVQMRILQDLKHYISQKYFWLGCHCCGGPQLQYYQLKVIDIDEQCYVGCFRKLKHLHGRRLVITTKKEGMAQKEWVQHRQAYEEVQKLQ